jgi:hypothetical protein
MTAPHRCRFEKEVGMRLGMKMALATGAALLLGPRAMAQGTGSWLHVRVEEARGSKVNVNLPLTVVDAALKAAPETVVPDDTVRIGSRGCHMRVADFRKMWAEVKKVGDTDFVTAEDEGGEKVTVSKKGELVLVRVEKAGREEVHVDVPADVVDALFAGEGNTLNVRAALSKLATRRGDIVRVNDKDSNVRVWIDEK